jgi:hypothetical protein
MRSPRCRSPAASRCSTCCRRYALGDSFSISHSLHRSFRDAKGFYLPFTALVAAAAGIMLIPGAPLGVVTGRAGPGRPATAQRQRVPPAAVE